MDKSPDAFRTISEVADDLDLPQHVLRFWETRFTQIKPMKRGGGRRYYRPRGCRPASRASATCSTTRATPSRACRSCCARTATSSSLPSAAATWRRGGDCPAQAGRNAADARRAAPHRGRGAGRRGRGRSRRADSSASAGRTTKARSRPTAASCRATTVHCCRRPCSTFWSASACSTRCVEAQGAPCPLGLGQAVFDNEQDWRECRRIGLTGTVLSRYIATGPECSAAR